MDKHEILCAFKDWVAQNGRAPTMAEFTDGNITEHMVKSRFGNLSGLANAAGVSIKKSNRLVSNAVFEKDIEAHLDQYSPKEFQSPKTDRHILVIGDIHAPFVHLPTMELIFRYNREHKPCTIVQVGDALDFYAHSKFPRSQNIYGPQEEERLGREFLEKMWAQLQVENPGVKCLMLRGNHCIRPVKRALESAPSVEHIVEAHLDRLFTFDGVQSVHDHRDVLEIDGILFHHGYLGKLGDHRDSALCNFVVGHTHRGGVSYRRIRTETLWELNAGFCGDPDSKAMSYTGSKIQNYTLGFGVIDKFGPRFIHA